MLQRLTCLMLIVDGFLRTLWKKSGTGLKFSYVYHPQTNGDTWVVTRIWVIYSEDLLERSQHKGF